MQHIWQIGWPCFWLLIVAFICIFVPLVIRGKFRLGYAALLSSTGLAMVLFMAFRGMYWFDQWAIAVEFNRANAREGMACFLDWGDGGVSALIRHHHDLDPDELLKAPREPHIIWYPMSRKQYPSPFRKPLVSEYGFQLIWFSEPPRPATITIPHAWGVIVPVWAPMIPLAVPPALYIRRLLRHRKRRLWSAAGKCANCGFDLRAHEPGGKCPECSTIIPASHQPSAPSPARSENSTQG